MRIVITGADGFIGRNLSVRLGELGHTDIARITLDSSDEDLKAALKAADFVFHLAGINRPKDVSEFTTGNAGLTETVCNLLAEYGNKAPVVLSSSTQAALDTFRAGGFEALVARAIHAARVRGAELSAAND